MKFSIKYLTLLISTFLIVSFATSCNEKTESTETAVVASLPAFDLAAAKNEIQATNNEFKAFFAAADSVGVGSLYTEDTKFMMTGGPSINGRENVVSTFSAIIKSGITGVDLRTKEVWGTNEFVTEVGEYSLFAGETEADHGKFMVLWKNVDGAWKLHRDIFNTDVSAE